MAEGWIECCCTLKHGHSTIALFSQICTHNILKLVASVASSQTHTQSGERKNNKSTWLLQIHVQLSHCCFRGWMILASMPDRIWSWLSILYFILKSFASLSNSVDIHCVYECSSGGKKHHTEKRVYWELFNYLNTHDWDMFYYRLHICTLMRVSTFFSFLKN